MAESKDYYRGVEHMWSGEYAPHVKDKFNAIQEHLANKANYLCPSCGTSKENTCAPCIRCGATDCA